MKIIPTLLLLFTSFASLAQISDSKRNEEVDLNVLAAELEGTYQVIMINTRTLPAIHLSVFPKIKKMRKQNEEVFLKIDDKTKIKILPYSVIEAPGFIPPERIIHISE